jgi:fumarylpyruvate hydrolase
MRYVFPPPPVAALRVLGTDALFPVHRIYCVGRNYAEHAREMGHDPDREPPFFFQKSPDNLRTDGRFPYPPMSEDVHHEIELVLALKSGGTEIPVDRALDHVFGYGLALDMTRRDLQAAMKKAGRPWEVAKSFEGSAPATALVPVAITGHPERGAIRLEVNGEIRQDGDLAAMIWKVPEIIAHLSALFTLAPGDLILTGTPAGVGPVARGDRLLGRVEVPGIEELRVEVV